MKVCSLTDIGVRREMNQDYFFSSEEPVGALPNLFIVADGMGGHNGGEIASKNVVETMCAVAQKTRKIKIANILTECVEKANKDLRAYADEHTEMKGMGTTTVAAVISDHTLFAANVGDSRMYVVGEEIRQITSDHSLVQEMVRRGEIDEELARVHPDKNIITRAVGASDKIKVDIFEETLAQGELILLCSDGLTNMVEDDEILQVLHRPKDLESNTEYLVELANEHGGKDNITVITIDPEFER
ncbi:MAG: Stp1/IreP family PP2C-type Ser/Thr phosphatase [Lachnospiraceae bacterium]|nr:Stp1/IreP family PP2C-type Ser/Thr phosphatase [Lachnospiraceae bacterium]